MAASNTSRHILCTGGAGYIGSHTVLRLIQSGFKVSIFDNLANSSPKVIDRIFELTNVRVPLFKIDMCDAEAVMKLFVDNDFDGVIHFAGLKAVGESVAQPLRYYENNIQGTYNILRAMQRSIRCKTLVFSSSATVYKPSDDPLDESKPLGCSNPYGWTKLMIEQILQDVAKADQTLAISILRYFNPVGAHHSGRIGESPNSTPNNLMPLLQQVAVGRRDHVKVFGTDYDTPDGTGVRDYIHVEDLAEGHVCALETVLRLGAGVLVHNLGSGHGYSVLDMIDAMEKASGKSIKRICTDRRPGDLATVVANAAKAEADFGWKTKRGLEEMCNSAWKWQSENPYGYDDPSDAQETKPTGISPCFSEVPGRTKLVENSPRHILCTGGAGYIGSHTVLRLIQSGFKVAMFDNLANSSPKVIDRIFELTGVRVPLFKVDMCNAEAVMKLFTENDFDGVIHFAGLKAVGESVAQPLRYYENNIEGTYNILRAMQKSLRCKTLVFSSSATVYKPSDDPLDESKPLGCSNPYGWTKLMIEQILQDVARADQTLAISILRYFNPVGAHHSGRIGESPNSTPNNLMPLLQQVAVGRRDHVKVFGTDYDTPDGTGVRDYIHVEDLAEGHVCALEKVLSLGTGVLIHNLGSGHGYSVLDMIDAMEKASGKSIKRICTDRRPGDLATVVANAAKAEADFGWKTKRGLEEMCNSAWKWQSENPYGYDEPERSKEIGSQQQVASGGVRPRSLSLPEAVRAAGGIDAWNSASVDISLLSDRLTKLCTATTVDEALAEVQAIMSLGPEHNFWAYAYMRTLYKKSVDLYYGLLLAAPAMLLPVVYTPTVGEACQKFGKLPFARRGCYVSIRDRGRIKNVLEEYAAAELSRGPDGKFLCDCIVFSDGGRILGLGDLGAWGMGIPIGKLDLYTVCGGVNPYRTIPVIFDVGCTDMRGNTDRLLVRDHERYTGLKQDRVTHKSEAGTMVNSAYYGEGNMVEEFMQAASDIFGKNCLLQYEDFNSNDAFPLLAKYRDKYVTYNDDIQGTAAVTLAAMLGAIKLRKPECTDLLGELQKHTYFFHGAGSANLGTMSLLANEARVPKTSIFTTNSRGIIWKSEDGTEGSFRNDEQKAFAQVGKPSYDGKDLVAAIRHVKPMLIAGAVGRDPGCFSEKVVRAMVDVNKGERPVIFALSNPKTQAEVTSTDAYAWSDGAAIYGSGTGMPSVEVAGQMRIPGQVNNVYIFPGVSMGVIASQARTIPERFFLVAAEAVANSLDKVDMQMDSVVPRRERIRDVGLNVAVAVALEAQRLGLAGRKLGDNGREVRAAIMKMMWQPELDLSKMVLAVFRQRDTKGTGLVSRSVMCRVLSDTGINGAEPFVDAYCTATGQDQIDYKTFIDFVFNGS